MSGHQATESETARPPEPQLVSDKVRERVETSGLLEPGEVVRAYVNGHGVRPSLKAATGVLLLPLVARSYRAFVLTDRQIYVFDMKASGAGAVKRVRAKYPIGSVPVSLTEAHGGWRKLQIEDHMIYVVNRAEPLVPAQAIVDAGGSAG